MTDPKTTGLIHHPYRPPAGFEAVAPAVHKASTVVFADTAALHARDWKSRDGYTYGLHGTPTTYLLEERIAALEGGLQCLLLPSGLAAITLVDTALLGSGDLVAIPDNAYGPGKELARHELSRWGIRHRFYDRARSVIARRGAAQRTGGRPPAGLARGARLGDDGVSRPAGAARGDAHSTARSARSTTPGAPASPSIRSRSDAMPLARRAASTSACRR